MRVADAKFWLLVGATGIVGGPVNTWGKIEYNVAEPDTSKELGKSKCICSIAIL